MRVRGFTQDDAHIFCLPEQVEDEIVAVLDLTETILSKVRGGKGGRDEKGRE
jgi:threonyl-tRNA synthetase